MQQINKSQIVLDQIRNLKIPFLFLVSIVEICIYFKMFSIKPESILCMNSLSAEYTNLCASLVVAHFQNYKSDSFIFNFSKKL
jgi:hypothetical protein